MRRTVSILVLLAAGAVAPAHDTWLQTNTPVVRTGEAVFIDLMLGNHGNDHRDFKLASKLSPELIQAFAVTGPDGKSHDLKPGLVDQGNTPKEGYYAARFVPTAPGVYVAGQTLDKVMQKGKALRAYRSAKTLFLASPSLDKLPAKLSGIDKPLGHRIELVPESDVLGDIGPGRPVKVRLMYLGKPLAGVKVSFIPRGAALKEGTDPEFERTTDADGRASYTPKAGNYLLVVAHHPAAETGDGYEAAHYSATLTVIVPEKCPCCVE
jgi:uncharacterized GH25 family protein